MTPNRLASDMKSAGAAWNTARNATGATGIDARASNTTMTAGRSAGKVSTTLRLPRRGWIACSIRSVTHTAVAVADHCRPNSLQTAAIHFRGGLALAGTVAVFCLLLGIAGRVNHDPDGSVVPVKQQGRGRGEGQPDLHRIGCHGN